jgi:hypothetical protein
VVILIDPATFKRLDKLGGGFAEDINLGRVCKLGMDDRIEV